MLACFYPNTDLHRVISQGKTGKGAFCAYVMMVMCGEKKKVIIILQVEVKRRKKNV